MILLPLRTLLTSLLLLLPTTILSQSQPEPKTTRSPLASIALDSSKLIEVSTLQSRIEAGEAQQVLELVAEMIEEIKSTRTNFDVALVEPLLLFGDANRKLGKYIAAIDAYRDAKQIARINNGLHAIEQVEAVHREAQTYYELGHIGDANDSYEYIFTIYNQQYEAFSPELLPAVFMLADWYVMTYNVFAARGLYEYATKIVDQHLERTSPENVRALQGLAQTYRLERFRPLAALGDIEVRIPTLYWADATPFRYFAVVNDFQAGEDTLIELVKIELERPDSTKESKANAKLKLADWFTLFNDHRRALVIYRDILDTYGNAGGSSFLHQEFNQPVPLYLPLSGSPDPQPRQLETEPVQAEVGFIVDINENGRVTNVQFDFAHPESEHVEQFQKTLRNAVYRPQFVDNDPVARTNVLVEHTYVFFPRKK